MIAEIDAQPIPRWEEYSVTKDGRVFGSAGELTVSVNPRGYRFVSLKGDGRWRKVKVSRLVLETFAGPANGRLARHLDDDKSNDTLDNLAWGTQKENVEDARRNGKLRQGVAHGMTIYTPEQIRLVRKMKEKGFSDLEISKLTRIGRTTVWQIVTKRQWRCLT